MLELVLKFRLAHNLVAENYSRAGYVCLSVCFEHLSIVLAARRTSLLYVLNAALEVSTDFNLPEILAMLFWYLHDIARIKLGVTHPATEIARRFGKLDVGQHADVLRIMRRLRVDFEDEQQTAETAFSIYDRSIGVWSECTENRVSRLQLMLSDCDAVRQSYLMALWVRMRVAIFMLGQGRDPVQEMMSSEYSSVAFQHREAMTASFILHCYKIRGHVCLQKRMLQNAAAYFEGGLVLADATWGKHNGVSIGFAHDKEAVRLLQNQVANQDV